MYTDILKKSLAEIVLLICLCNRNGLLGAASVSPGMDNVCRGVPYNGPIICCTKCYLPSITLQNMAVVECLLLFPLKLVAWLR